ncbi:hypothetical protein ACLOJK_000956 [Asimina triloba]
MYKMRVQMVDDDSGVAWHNEKDKTAPKEKKSKKPVWEKRSTVTMVDLQDFHHRYNIPKEFELYLADMDNNLMTYRKGCLGIYKSMFKVSNGLPFKPEVIDILMTTKKKPLNWFDSKEGFRKNCRVHEIPNFSQRGAWLSNLIPKMEELRKRESIP